MCRRKAVTVIVLSRYRIYADNVHAFAGAEHSQRSSHQATNPRQLRIFTVSANEYAL